MSSRIAVPYEDSPPAPTGWHAGSLRLTVFPTPDEAPSIQNWWEDLLDEPPEQVISTPKTGETQLQGIFNQELLLLNAQVMRIELRHTVKPPDQPLPQIPTLGAYEEARQAFRDLVLKGLALETFPPIQRLAFGAILTRPVDRLRSGYEMLRGYLPAVEISVDSSDFLYQINRRRPSRVVDGITLNRLSKWSVQKAQGVTVLGDGTVERQPTEFSCRTELDINSAPEHTDELPKACLQDLFIECVELADELAVRGDVP